MVRIGGVSAEAVGMAAARISATVRCAALRRTNSIAMIFSAV